MDAEFDFEIGATPPVNDAQFEKFWTNFSESVKGDRAEKSAERDSFLRDIFSSHEAGFEAMELLHETANEAINWASSTVHDTLGDDAEDDAFAEYINVLVGLGGRAVLAFNEVTWLLRGGYPHGALTRVRSLQELFVVAAALGLYGSPGGAHPELVERYSIHHEVFTHKIATDLLATGNEGLDETLDDNVLQALLQKRQTLIAIYGKNFSQ